MRTRSSQYGDRPVVIVSFKEWKERNLKRNEEECVRHHPAYHYMNFEKTEEGEGLKE